MTTERQDAEYRCLSQAIATAVAPVLAVGAGYYLSNRPKSDASATQQQKQLAPQTKQD